MTTIGVIRRQKVKKIYKDYLVVIIFSLYLSSRRQIP